MSSAVSACQKVNGLGRMSSLEKVKGQGCVAFATSCHELVHRPSGKLRLRFHLRPSQTFPPLPMNPQNPQNQRNRGFEGFVGFEGAFKKGEMFLRAGGGCLPES